MGQGFATLSLQRDARGIVTVTLERPDLRNAFNADVILELTQAFLGPCSEVGVRAVLLRGRGSAFCAGADLQWMQASARLSQEENRTEAERMAKMFRSITECPAPVVAVVHGAAMGGGAGLIAAADVAVGALDCRIGFTEVRLGIVPAVISPFVLRKIGRTHAQRYFVSGEIFDGAEAERIGLLQRAVPADRLEDEVTRLVESMLLAGPMAMREAKRLIDLVDAVPVRDCTTVTAPLIARLRTSPEGQEGMTAFFEKRPASWAPPKGAKP